MTFREHSNSVQSKEREGRRKVQFVTLNLFFY